MSRNAKREAIQKLRYYAKNSGIFANLESIGSYDDFSQTVVLDYLDEESFLRLLESFKSYTKGDKSAQKVALQVNYKSSTQFYSTCVHELTHWLDHTSTLWGQRQLIFIYNAINAWTNQNEQEFYRIAIANSERHRARLAIYYTEKYKVDHQEVRLTPWQFEYGSGLEFGVDGRPRTDRPFIFTVFSNSSNQPVIRVPFSMFALTEANATYAEFKVKSQSLALLDDNSRLVEKLRLEKEIQKNLYDPELVIYSVATHCLANSIGLEEGFQAYELSAALATLCLNLPKELFQSLSVPEEFNVWGSRVQALQELADPGFAFFTIAKQAPKYKDNISVEQWLQEALKNAGIPSLEIIKDLAIAQMQELENEVIEGLYADQLRDLLSIGRENFIQRGVWGQNILSIENLHKTSIKLPLIVLGDGYIIPVAYTNIPASPESMEQWIDRIINIEVSIDQFIRACRL
jgi:hypothetical protein